jgi:UrcA family protein
MTSRNFHPVRHALICTALAATMSLYASFASAEEETAPQRAVAYQTSELASDAGTQKLYNRLKTAARDVCSSHRTRRDAPALRAYKECYQEALDNAVADVNQQTLTALHDRSESRSARVHQAQSKADKSAS